MRRMTTTRSAATKQEEQLATLISLVQKSSQDLSEYCDCLSAQLERQSTQLEQQCGALREQQQELARYSEERLREIAAEQRCHWERIDDRQQHTDLQVEEMQAELTQLQKVLVGRAADEVVKTDPELSETVEGSVTKNLVPPKTVPHGQYILK